MKKILSLALAFTVSSLGLVSLLAQPVRAQQVAAVNKSISELKEEYERFLAVERDPSTPSEVKEINHQMLETRRTQLRTAIAARLGALRKYQSSMSATLSAEESLVVGNSIQELERELSAVSGEPIAPTTPTATTTPRARFVNTASTTTPAPDNTAPVSTAPKAATAFSGSLTPQVPPVIALQWTGPATVGVQNISLPYQVNDNTFLITTLNLTVQGPAAGQMSATPISINRQNGAMMVPVVNDVASATLFAGANTITLSDAGGSGAAPAVLHLTLAGAPPPAPTPTPTGRLVGLLLGGVVVSQQADNFSQADPFMGFVAGYSHYKPYGTELHWRVQGIFQVQPKKDEAPVASATASASPSPTPTPAASPTPTPVLGSNFAPFLASRKTFDLDMRMWIDRPFPAMFGDAKPNPNVRVGIYGLVGASTYLDKNELKGDQKVNINKDTTELDTANAKIDNDLDLFYEGGFIGNFYKNGDADRKLFLQASIGYGNYEALKGLDPTGKNTRNRFIGKLRIFPKFLDSTPDGGADSSPMFGVEINAGRGPDQIKFFTGIATAFKLFK